MMRKDNFLRRKNSFGNLFLGFFIEVSVLYKIHHSNFINEQFSNLIKKKNYFVSFVEFWIYYLLIP